MKAAVFYATREGQTRKIAERIASDLRGHEMEVDLRDVRTSHTPIDWDQYAVACITASVHVGHHEREMIDFVRRHRHDLHRLATAFFSVTLTEAEAEDVHAPSHRRKRAATDAQRMIDLFIRQTGWHPDRSLPVAGALSYSRYNWPIRFVMKRIARKAGAPTDTSRDYEFTNWAALDGLVDEMHRATLARVG